MIESLLAGQEQMKVERTDDREQLLAKIKADIDADREEEKKKRISIHNQLEKTLNLSKWKSDQQLGPSKRRWRLQSTPFSLR
jgi:hypothetical protein